MKFTIRKNFIFIIAWLAMINLGKIALASQNQDEEDASRQASTNYPSPSFSNNNSGMMDCSKYFHDDDTYREGLNPIDFRREEEEQNSRRVLTSHLPPEIAVIVLLYLPGDESIKLVVEKDFTLIKHVNSLAFDNYKSYITSHLSYFINLKSLEFWDKYFKDSDLSAIANHSTLTSLSLLGSGFSNSSLELLQCIKNLTFLRVLGDRVTDSVLKDMYSLTSLELSGNGFTRNVLSRVNKEKIEYLKLGGNQFTDETLHELHNLLALLIQGDRFTDRALEGVDKTKIKSLEVYGGQFTDAILRGLPQLEKLGISGSKFTNQALNYLDKSKIKSLKVFGNQFTSSIFDNLKNLESLEVSGREFTLSILREPLKGLRRLKSLIIHPIGEDRVKKYLKYQGSQVDDDIEGFHEVMM